MKKAHKKERIPYRTPYACRHTLASSMVTGGVDDKFGAGQLGHTIEMYHRTCGRWIAELGGQEQVAERWTKEGNKDV